METNKIYLGDAYELIKQIPDKSIDCIYTDIPYLMVYQGGGINGKIKGDVKRLLNEHYEQIMNGIDYKILDEFIRICKKIKVFIWCSKSQILDILNFFVKEHDCYFNILTWNKLNPAPFGGLPWLSDIEYCLCFYESGATFEPGCDHKKKWFTSNTNHNDAKEYGHPTIKPLELVKKHLINACGTNNNSIVLDPFIGSGTTAVACKQLNINYIGFEINADFYKIACDRVNGINKNGQTNLFETDFEQLDLFGGE